MSYLMGTAIFWFSRNGDEVAVATGRLTPLRTQEDMQAILF